MKDPAALLYIDVWKSATTEMTVIERGYYMDLILHQYDKGSLPSDIEELANICRVRFSEFEQFKQVFEQVLKHKFELNENNRLENGFASEIIRKRKSFVDKRSNAGKISYMIKFINKHFKVSNKVIERLKDEIDFDNIDMKNEQVFKQMLNEKINNLNVDGDGNINYNKDVNKIYEFALKYFQDEYKPKTDEQANQWKDTIEKLMRIDKKDKKEICETIKWAKEDEFWDQNFRSIKKLRQKDRQDTKYYDVFNLKRNKTTAPIKAGFSLKDI